MRRAAIEHVIRRAPRLQAATNRAIDAVLGLGIASPSATAGDGAKRGTHAPKRPRRAEFPEAGAIDQLFREARRNRA